MSARDERVGAAQDVVGTPYALNRSVSMALKRVKHQPRVYMRIFIYGSCA
jgi:hypothetical protein